MHTCIHAYMHTCIHAYMHTCIHAYMHTYIHTYIHPYIHTSIHTSIHTCSILTPKLSDKSHSGQDQLTPALSDASIFNVKNRNSFTGNHDSSKGDSSDSEGSNAIKVLGNIRIKFSKNVIIGHTSINSIANKIDALSLITKD